MDDRAIRDITQRLVELERSVVRYRQGVITDDAPLAVALGGSTVPYPNVKALESAGTLAVDDVVAVLTFGFDMLILGRLT